MIMIGKIVPKNVKNVKSLAAFMIHNENFVKKYKYGIIYLYFILLKLHFFLFT